MEVNWEEVQLALKPIKNYEDLCQRLRRSFSYAFVRETFNLTIPDLIGYTQKLLGGDARKRYDAYALHLTRTLTELHQIGVQNVLDLKSRVESREKLEDFVQRNVIKATDLAGVLKYLIYWFIPPEKYLSGLVRDNPVISNAIKGLSESGIRTNLQLLQRTITSQGRKSLAEATGISASIISELVNRADFSRLPWSSKATISNIIGAGYGSIEKLAHTDPEKLYADFFRYGKSIGKNLKLGNEIENSYRIVQIVPEILHGE